MLLNFGLVGVLVVSVLMGFGLGRLDRAFQAVDPRGVLGIATAVLPFYLLIMLRGSLLQATGTLVVIFVSLLFIAARPTPPTRPVKGLRTSAARAEGQLTDRPDRRGTF